MENYELVFTDAETKEIKETLEELARISVTAENKLTAVTINAVIRALLRYCEKQNVIKTAARAAN